jgi:hypothetical protein
LQQTAICQQTLSREEIMDRRHAICITATALLLVSATARAADDMKYPDWAGQWVRIGGGGQFDPTKPPRKGQQPPLTPEYEAIFEAHLKEGNNGGQDYNSQAHCLPGGMPRMMTAYEAMEVIITPPITYIYMAFGNEFRRIYTDGRDWPHEAPPTFSGYSIGHWVDQGGDGRFNLLEVETRNLKGPRQFDSGGIPLHKDNATVIEEKIYAEKSDPDTLRDQITTYDHALTRPWTVLRGYHRDHKEVWLDNICAESNQYVFLRHETYVIGGDGFLMPTRKGQPAPDLNYFDHPQH